MKRFLLSSLLVLAMGPVAHGQVFENDGTISVPAQQSPDTVQIDDPIFINNGTFNIDLSGIQVLSGPNILFTTSDTAYLTNNGTMTAIPGFDFRNWPASVGQAQPMTSFVNNNNGFGGGQIFATNIYGGVNPFQLGFSFNDGSRFPMNFDLPGLATVKIRSDSVTDSGLIQMDNSGLIDVAGKDLDLRRGQFVLTGSFGINLLDYGYGLFGSTNLQPWQPDLDLTPPTATSSVFISLFNGFFEQMSLGNATFYMQDPNPPVVNSNVVWRIIAIQDNSPTNVAHNVYFGNSPVGGGEFHVEWAGGYKDPVSGQTLTNYFYLSDDPALRRQTNIFLLLSPPPADFSVLETPVQAIGLLPTPPGNFVNPSPLFPNDIVTNDFSYISIQPLAVPFDTNAVVGGNPTNLPGRVQFSASQSMNLANAKVAGASYFDLNSPVDLVNYSNASLGAAYADLNIGVTSGSLIISNLLLPELPAWTGVPTAPNAVAGFSPMGGLQAWSASFIFVDTNGVTNDVRVLLVNSGLQPTAPTVQKDMYVHAPISLQINDVLNLFGIVGVDSASLTIETNASSAFSSAGALNLLSPNILWSTTFTNLQYLTNYGTISTLNLANFAGNMFSPLSSRAAATPYQAFVNHGLVSTEGAFIKANYFENSGVIQALVNNGLDIEISGTAWATNGTFIATNGPISISAGSLLASNGVIDAGQSLTFNTSCYLSDGYTLTNQFGHVTNGVIPNLVTNGNFWTAGAGVRIMNKPPTGDLLGTTITNIALTGIDSINVWPGIDRGRTPGGYTGNLALGRMIFTSDANPSHFTFASLTGNNALYVDSLEFKGNTTNTDVNGNYTAFTIQPGMRIYYAQALVNGFSIAEKLNGKNGGGFCWVSNYAGVFSSTNILYPDNNTYVFNEALSISPDIASGGPDGSNTGIVNLNNPYPIPTNWVFDIQNTGPVPCGNGGNGNGGDGGNGGNGTPGSGQAPGTLSYPGGQSESDSGSVSFAIAQGIYNGLFYDETNGVNPASSGSFTANVTTRGGFTAKLQLGGKTYSFSKSFDSFGHFSGNVTSKGLASLTVNLQLVNNDQIVGIVTGNGWSAQLTADRAAFSSKHPAPAAWIGKDTLLLSTDTENSSAAAGDSYGNVTVSKSGTVQWSGLLPDGTKVTQNSTLSKDGIWPLYSSAYGGSGSFIGWIQLTNSDPGITGSAIWIVPAGNSALYPGGLTNQLDATGSTLTGAAVSGQQQLVLTGASGSTTNNFILSGKNSQSGTLKVSLNAKTGIFTGTVVNGDQTLSFQGALLEKSGIGGGFFLNADKSQGGKVYLAPAN